MIPATVWCRLTPRMQTNDTLITYPQLLSQTYWNTHQKNSTKLSFICTLIVRQTQKPIPLEGENVGIYESI